MADELLTPEDKVFINEITKRCCDAPWGTVHAEVIYTALHFQAKAKPIIEEQGFAKGIGHYRKVILPSMIEKAKCEERERIFEKIEELDKKLPGYITFEEALKQPKKQAVVSIYLEDWQALKELK